MSKARLKARSLISQYGIDNPSILNDHLEDFCFELHASIQYQPLDGAEARIVANGGHGVITISSAQTNKERVRFSIGHELGHFLLHCSQVSEFTCGRKDMQDWFSKQQANNYEVEANEFSVELLIPEVLAKPLIEKKVPTIELIEEMANTFKMSLSASVLRFAELSEEPVAVVFFSKANGVKVPKMSKYFEQQKYWFPQGPLDKESLAYDVVNGKNHSKPMSIAASAWMELPEWLQDEMIMEQVRYFPAQDWGFSLLWIKKGALIRN